MAITLDASHTIFNTFDDSSHEPLNDSYGGDNSTESYENVLFDENFRLEYSKLQVDIGNIGSREQSKIILSRLEDMKSYCENEINFVIHRRKKLRGVQKYDNFAKSCNSITFIKIKIYDGELIKVSQMLDNIKTLIEFIENVCRIVWKS